MTEGAFPYDPIPGKTYSLFGDSVSTERYYALIRELADECLVKFPDLELLLGIVRKSSRSKRLLRRARDGDGNPDLTFIASRIGPALSEYTVLVEKHLGELSPLQFWDRRLRTTEEQYHFYMLEIELVNRLNLNKFKECDTKIALLPYCLQDWSGKCRSSMGDLDFVCRRCSSKCYINRTSEALREQGISAYIWMSGDLKKLKRIPRSGGRVGGLGIACVPELVMGLRSSEHLGIPAIGLPLDANRCIRWTGTFSPNSVNLKRLEELLR